MRNFQPWHKDKYARLELIFYGVVWLIAFLVPVISQVIDLISKQQAGFDHALAERRFVQTLPFFVLFLLNNFVFNPLLLKRGKFFFYFLSTVGMLAALWFYSGISRFTPLSITQGGRIGNIIIFHQSSYFVDLVRVTTVCLGLIIIMANEMVKSFINSMRKDQIMLQIRANHTQTELSALKYQLDPHFLMNALNSVQALIYIDPERASYAIQLLSRLMRHLLYGTGDSTTLLSKEIEFIKVLIELMRLKYSQNVNIVTSFPVVDNSMRIPPRLFSSYIENAFKYGIGDNGESQIEISIAIEANSLYFHCSNKIMRAVEESPNGIGMKNAERRFDLLYGHSYRLDISNDGTHFTVDVVIPIFYNGADAPGNFNF